MLDILLNFERQAEFLNANTLLCFGIVVLTVGIVMWLAGMALRRPFLFSAGAIAGVFVSFHFVGRKIASAIGLAALGAFLAAIFNKFFVTILAAALAAAIALTMLAWHYDTITDAATANNISRQLNHYQTVYYCQEVLDGFLIRAKLACQYIPSLNWLIIPLIIVIFIAAGIFFWNVICAWLWAASGTIFIFAAMASLLLYKGSTPVTLVFHNSSTFSAIFTSMIAIGTITQLLLFHYIKPKESAKKTNAEDAKERKGWRAL